MSDGPTLEAQAGAPRLPLAPPTATPGRARGLLLLLVLLAGGLTLTLLGRARALALRAGWPAEADLMYLPSSTTLRWLALGHHELAADLVAARTNVYYGTQIASKAPQRWLDRYVHTAIDLDPRFHRLYGSGAAMVTYYGGPITVAVLEKANAILQRGVDAFPADWNLHFQLGFNRFFELPNAAGASDPRVPRWRQEGIESLRQATLFADAPAWLPNLVARLLTKQGADELAVRHLEQAYAAAASEETRLQIRAKLETLHRSRLLDEIEKGRRSFEEELARGYPYAPEAFTVIAGPRAPRWLDLPGSRPQRAAPPGDQPPAPRPSLRP